MLSILCRLLWTGMMLILSILTILTLAVILFKFSIGTVLYMATNKRHFQWFSCDLKLTLCLADQVRTDFSCFSFYSELPLSAIQSFVKLDRYLPKSFCSVQVSFRSLEPVLSPDFSLRVFHMRSYSEIEQMAIRNIIYTLTIEKLIYEFQVDKTL